MNADWRIFDALTCDHPMLADIKDWMLPPFSEKDKERWPPVEKETTVSVDAETKRRFEESLKQAYTPEVLKALQHTRPIRVTNFDRMRWWFRDACQRVKKAWYVLMGKEY